VIKLKKDFLKGSYPPIITPFKPNGNVDIDSFRKCVDFSIRNGSHGVLISGTTSEPSTLTLEERIQLYKEAIDKGSEEKPDKEKRAEAGVSLLRAHRGFPKHTRLMKLLQEPEFSKLKNETELEYLRDQGAALVGIDSHNIDDTRGRRRPVHTILLGAGIPIVEHMTGLSALPASGFRFSAVPPKIRGMGTFPVRAHARLD